MKKTCLLLGFLFGLIVMVGCTLPINSWPDEPKQGFKASTGSYVVQADYMAFVLFIPAPSGAYETQYRYAGREGNKIKIRKIVSGTSQPSQQVTSDQTYTYNLEESRWISFANHELGVYKATQSEIRGNYVKLFGEDVRKKGERAFIGVNLVENEGEKQGGLVQKVYSGTPADKAGIKSGDIIKSIESERFPKIEIGNVTPAEQVAIYVAGLNVGEKVRLEISKEDSNKTDTVSLVTTSREKAAIETKK